MKTPLTEPQTCATCIHWNNKQAELDYSRHVGICNCNKWKFTVTNTADVMLLDRNNKSEMHMSVQRFESASNIVPIGAVTQSRYCFVTEEEFGCIHHYNKDKNKK